MRTNSTDQTTPLTRVGVLCLAAAAFLGSQVVGAQTPDAGQNALIEQTPNAFFPLEPCRLMDTRQPIGDGTNRSEPVGEGETATQQVTGENGQCIVPDNASAVSLNVTAVGGTATSFLTLFPADSPTTPLASNLNWTPGASPTPNKVDVELSATGEMSLFNSLGTVDVIVDVAGYYSSERLNDTRGRTVRLERALPTADSVTRAAASMDGSNENGTLVENHVIEQLGGAAIVSYNLSYIGVSTWPDTIECIIAASGSGTERARQRGSVSGTQVLHLGDSTVLELSRREPTEVTLSCRPVAPKINSAVLLTEIELTVLVLPDLEPAP